MPFVMDNEGGRIQLFEMKFSVTTAYMHTFVKRTCTRRRINGCITISEIILHECSCFIAFIKRVVEKR